MEIHHKNASKLSFEELYRTAYALVLRKFGKRLYDAVVQDIREYLNETVVSSLGNLINTTSKKSRPNTVEVLKAVRDRFDDHCICMRMISDILMYLDRAYSKEVGMPLIYDAGLTLFRDTVIRNKHQPIGVPLYDLIIGEIKRERDGENIDRMSIKSVVNMLESFPNQKLEGISLYVAEFEPRFQVATEEYFDSAASQLIQVNKDASVYFTRIKTWLDEEADRCNIYLTPSTLSKIVPTVERVLLTNRMEMVLELSHTGFIFWIDNDKFSELKLAFELTARMSDPEDAKKGMEIIHRLLSEKIIASGREINQSAVNVSEEIKAAKASGIRDKSLLVNPTAVSIQWIEKVLILKEKYNNILKQCFDGEVSTHIQIENAFATFINENKKVAEYLSLFIDDSLKKSIKGKTEEEIEEILERCIILFRLISDKDLFETYYKAHLAKRLLNSKSLSDDVERNLVARLRMEMGASFTNKLEGMFRDMKVSGEQISEFKNLRQSGTINLSVDINVNVLTTTFWPSSVVSANVKCKFPPEVEKARIAFEDFYLKKHSGRVISWNPNMGTAEVRATYKRTHDINMPTIAMTILLLFNDVPPGASLTYGEIQSATNIPDAELCRHLQSIAVAPRTRLLRKDPFSKDVKPTDKFCINEKFESPMTRIKVLTVSSSNKAENDAERKETVEKVDRARKYETDAAIVRIMKYVEFLFNNIKIYKS